MQTVWVEVTTRTQRQLVRLLDDDTTFIQTENGAVVLDLRPIVIELGDQVAVIGKVAERLPESSGRSPSSKKSQLETAQTITKILRAVADWMWLLALAVAALAVWLARGRRRLELRAIAIGLLLVGLLLLPYAASRATTSSTRSRRTTRSSRRDTTPGASSRRPSPTAPGCGSSSASSRSSESGSSVPPTRRPGAPSRSPGFGEAHDHLQHRRGCPACTGPRRSADLARLAVDAPAGRPRRRRHRGHPKHRPAGTKPKPLRSNTYLA